MKNIFEKFYNIVLYLLEMKKYCLLYRNVKLLISTKVMKLI